MCLAVPAQLVSRNGTRAVADLDGNRVPICTALVPAAAEGDWVLVHAGFAIEQLSPEDARKILGLGRSIARAAGDRTASPDPGTPKT